jgi:hypothetical protein
MMVSVRLDCTLWIYVLKTRTMSHAFVQLVLQSIRRPQESLQPLQYTNHQHDVHQDDDEYTYVQQDERTDHSDRKGEQIRHVLPTIRYESASASQMVLERQEHVHVDIIIVDPPRKGLDLDVSREFLWKTEEMKWQL